MKKRISLDRKEIVILYVAMSILMGSPLMSQEGDERFKTLKALGWQVWRRLGRLLLKVEDVDAEMSELTAILDAHKVQKPQE